MHLDLNRASISILVTNFYTDVGRDERLCVIFNAVLGANWASHVERLVDFWCTIMLGTNDFKGNVYGKHMGITGIDSNHFQRWLELFECNVNQLFQPNVCEKFLTVARRIAGSLQYGLLENYIRTNSLTMP